MTALTPAPLPRGGSGERETGLEGREPPLPADQL